MLKWNLVCRSMQWHHSVTKEHENWHFCHATFLHKCSIWRTYFALEINLHTLSNMNVKSHNYYLSGTKLHQYIIFKKLKMNRIYVLRRGCSLQKSASMCKFKWNKIIFKPQLLPGTAKFKQWRCNVLHSCVWNWKVKPDRNKPAIAIYKSAYRSVCHDEPNIFSGLEKKSLYMIPA